MGFQLDRTERLILSDFAQERSRAWGKVARTREDVNLPSDSERACEERWQQISDRLLEIREL